MNRNWNNIFMEMLEILKRRSTCLRIQTSAILVRDTRIISMGYNGVISGVKHCYEYWKEYCLNNELNFDEFVKTEKFYNEHHTWATKNEVHGEQNAILYASRNGIPTNNCVMYTLFAPCINCAKVIITCGINKVYYKELYKRDCTGLEFLEECGIECKQIIIFE